jgi:hypothetical protein
MLERVSTGKSATCCYSRYRPDAGSRTSLRNVGFRSTMSHMIAVENFSAFNRRESKRYIIDFLVRPHENTFSKVNCAVVLWPDQAELEGREEACNKFLFLTKQTFCTLSTKIVMPSQTVIKSFPPNNHDCWNYRSVYSYLPLLSPSYDWIARMFNEECRLLGCGAV